MMRRFRSRVRARWRALTGSASTAAAALGLLVCLCTLLAVAGPRAAAQVRTTAFRQLIATTPATDKTVIGAVSDSTLGSGQPLGLDAGLIERTKARLRENLRTLPLSPAATDWSSLTFPFLAVTGYGAGAAAELPPKLELSYRDALARNVRVISGRLPGSGTRAGSALILQAAVSMATARRFGLGIGSRLTLPGTSIVLAVAAIVQPRDPAAPFWSTDPVLAAPQLQHPATHPFWLGGVFVAADAVAALQSQINAGDAQVTWMFPLAVDHFTAAQAGQLQSALTAALATAGTITVGGGGAPIPVQIALTCGTGQLIAGFEAEAGSVASVLDLLSVSLAVVAAVVVLLSGWLLTEQRRQEFAALRARGASRRQLAQAVLGGTAVTAVPGAAAGAVAAVTMTPASQVSLSWWLAGLLVAAALAGPVLITARTHRGYVAIVRPDQPLGRLSSIRRWIVEAALIAGAAGGLLVLRYEGGGASGDLYASAAPVLLAVGVAVILVRVYPLLVRGVLRLRGQRASAATFLGLARAARASASAALPAFALVLALALVSFAGMVRAAVVRGQVGTSWQQAGADAVISEPGTVTAALQRAVAAVPGVRHVAVAGIASASATGGRMFTVLAVAPGQYAAVVAGSPLPQPPRAFTASAQAGAVPALATPVLAGQLGHGPVGVLISDRTIRARVVGPAASMSAVSDLSNGYLVLPRLALGDVAPPPRMLLVGGSGLNHAALAAAVSRYGRGGTVVYRSRLLAGLEDAPLQHGAVVAMTLGGAAAGACGLLVLLLSLLLSASAREQALARVATMGLTGTQARLLGLVELLPQLLAVLVGGLASAVALVPLISPALNLAVFTRSGSGVPVRVEPGWLLITAAGLLVLAIVTLTGQTMVIGRTAARSLRMGE